ncbi:threonine aldolase family protein [Siccirubricoccus deserti]
MVHAPARPPAGAPPVRINLYSDTQTRPTAAMKDAMFRAEVGDEQHGDDPTVHALCDRMAALMGKEAAIFLPSGTMCNVVAILTHCGKGDEVVAHETAHILFSEGGAHAAFTGVQIMPLKGAGGMFTADDVRAAIRPKTRYTPPQRLLEVEQTANIGGGKVWPLAQLNAVAAVAHGEGWATHMDGARLMNACVAAGVAPKDMVASYDSVWLDFTKGLGAPLGAVLCGSSDFIGAAWRWKQRLGGSMRQAGSAPPPVSMRWTTMSTGWRKTTPTPRRWPAACGRSRGWWSRSRRPTWCSSTSRGRLRRTDPAAPAGHAGVAVSGLGGRVRACTHLDVTAPMIEEAIGLIRAALHG